MAERKTVPVETSIISTNSSNYALATLAPIADHARELIAASLPPNTKRSYFASWKRFCEWYGGFSKGDPRDATHESVAMYLATLDREGLLPQSLTVAYAGISFFLRSRHPQRWEEKRRPIVIARLIKGAYQKRGQPAKKKRGLTAAELRRALEMGLWSGIWLLRARAVLLVGFAGGFRRSELCALLRKNVRLTSEGLELLLVRSKTDQHGRGRRVGIHYGEDGMCAVMALRQWCIGARLADGYLFRSITPGGRVLEAPMDEGAVAQLVKDVAEGLGYNVDDYSGHSLRRGFCTQADRNGQGLPSIMKTTGHKSAKMVLGYIEEGKLFEKNASKGIFK